MGKFLDSLNKGMNTLNNIHDDCVQNQEKIQEAIGNRPMYVVLQVTLKEKLIGTGSRNLSQLEKVINEQAAKGYRLHTITNTESFSKGIAGGDRVQATLVFEKILI